MKRDFELIIITVYGIFINLRNEPKLTFLNAPQLEKYRYDLVQLW
jgi:hypothetical protein